LFPFDLAEGCFSAAIEDAGNSKAGGLLDTRVQVLEPPRELAREENSYRGFAGTHESD
jgi:hypothetical protein